MLRLHALQAENASLWGVEGQGGPKEGVPAQLTTSRAATGGRSGAMGI